MKEIWKDIDGYEGTYSISNKGFVRNNKTGKTLSNIKKDSGYIVVKLKGKSVSLHRLVLSTFDPIENPEIYEVDHLDNVKSNNELDNLQWVTHSENQIRRFARSKEGIPDRIYNSSNKAKPIVVRNISSGALARFDSLTSFCNFMGFPHGTVYRHMQESKPYKNYFLRRL